VAVSQQLDTANANAIGGPQPDDLWANGMTREQRDSCIDLAVTGGDVDSSQHFIF